MNKLIEPIIPEQKEIIFEYPAPDGTMRQWRYTEEEKPVTDASCYDCGLAYEYAGDLVLPDNVWRRISPRMDSDAGILCPNCILQRLHFLGISGIGAILW